MSAYREYFLDGISRAGKLNPYGKLEWVPSRSYYYQFIQLQQELTIPSKLLYLSELTHLCIIHRQIIQIMDARKDKIRIDELVNKLQRHKGEIMRQEERAKQQMKSFFRDLIDSLESYQSQIVRQFDEDVLNFHEGAFKTINILLKLKDNAPDDTIDNAEEILNCQVFDGTKIDREKIKQLLREVYYLKIGAFHNDSKVDLPQMSESHFSADEKMYSQSAVQKLQSERDYYQRREQQLQKKLRELEMNRRGTNIRELSKSALEQKCSRWAIQRLKEQKRVLIQKIGEASQQIIKQDSLLSQQQEQIKKLNAIISQSNGKSIVGSSGIKGSSIALQSQISHVREIQLQGKVTQLTLQLTNCMHRLETIYRANQQFQKQLEEKIRQNQKLQYENADIKKENTMINNDYEASLRKKATIQQQYNELKKIFDQINAKLEEQRQTYNSVVEGLQVSQKEIKQRLRRMQFEKQTEISLIQQKLITSQLEREKLLKKLQQISMKNGDNSSHKQLLNDQITRLLRQNDNIVKQLLIKEEQVFQAKQEAKRLQSQVRQQTKRNETSKKQITTLKKSNKQLEKQIAQLRNRMSSIENVELKILQLDQNITSLNNQFIKYKENSQRRKNLHQKIVTIMKERFTYQLSTLLPDEGRKMKKEKSNKIEIIQKYIEQMITFSTKTAQIKQLKQEIRDLKEGKQTKQTKKKQKGNIQQTVNALQWGLWQTKTKIFEERLRNERQLFQERLAEVIEMHKKEETIKNGLAEELQRQRSALAQMKSKQKQEKVVEQSSKVNKQLQDKNERLQQQIKRLKAKIKKLQLDVSESQSELKTKRQLSAGLKAQCKMKQDEIAQLSKMIEQLRGQIAKHQRNTRQMFNKQELLKQSKESQKKMEEQYRQLLDSLEELTEKNKLLTRQLTKKDQVIKELNYIQDKQIKKKQDAIIKSLRNEIADLNETVRKLKMDNDRKDQIIKNNKNKMQNKNKQNQQLIFKTQKQNDKITKQKESLQRKVDSLTSNLKRYQMKSTNLAWTIKKIFQMCCQTSTISQKQTCKAKPLTTQYYSNSSVSPLTLKLGTPASNIKSYISCEGLDILNLRPQDLQQCLGLEATTINKTDIRNQSWSMASPILNKRKQQQKKQLLMQGLEELERLLTAQEMNSALLIDQFKKVLDK